MTAPVLGLLPGCVVVTATKDKGGRWIRWRSWLMRRPARHNHVVIFTHFDETGRPRGVEGRPGGFGWANLEPYLEHPATVTNAEQPLTDEQRESIVRAATAAVGIPYDWAAIIAFALGTVGLPFLPSEWPEDGLPSQGVCSSGADLFYEGCGAANPGGWQRTRGTDVDDWSEFISHRMWLA